VSVNTDRRSRLAEIRQIVHDVVQGREDSGAAANGLARIVSEISRTSARDGDASFQLLLAQAYLALATVRGAAGDGARVIEPVDLALECLNAVHAPRATALRGLVRYTKALALLGWAEGVRDGSRNHAISEAFKLLAQAADLELRGKPYARWQSWAYSYAAQAAAELGYPHTAALAGKLALKIARKYNFKEDWRDAASRSYVNARSVYPIVITEHFYDFSDIAGASDAA
jgi:hypothetical protein